MSEPVKLTDSSFSQIKDHFLALVDFWADWCGPCRMMMPIVKELAAEYAGRVFVGELDVDANPKTARKFRVYSIPALIIMRNGVEVDRIVGCVPKEQLAAMLKKQLG